MSDVKCRKEPRSEGSRRAAEVNMRNLKESKIIGRCIRSIIDRQTDGHRYAYNQTGDDEEGITNTIEFRTEQK